MQRYETVLEPTGTFAVFDILTGLPAEHEGRTLIGLQLGEAELIIDRYLSSVAYTAPLLTSSRWMRPD